MKVTLPKEERVVFPGQKLVVYWLALPGDSLPAMKEYRKEIDPTMAEASFRTIDRLLCNGERMPSNYMSKLRIDSSLNLWEIRAPKSGREIGRLLGYRHQNWEIYLALCRKKKSQKVPEAWKKTAGDRVRRSLKAGGP